MLLVVDIGNTSISIGGFKKDKLEFKANMYTEQTRTAYQYAIEFRNIFELLKVDYKEITGSIISSVVPDLSKVIQTAIFLCCNIKSAIIGPGIKTGLDIKLDNPAQLGADLAACAIGALNLYPLPCIIFDFGTATTVSVISKDSVFLGGIVCAGIKTSLNALASKTSLLPNISIEAPTNIIGRNSIDCMRSGAVYGTAIMVDGFCDKIEKELGQKCTLVATGGFAKEVISYCDKEIIVNEDLIFQGLKYVYNKNFSK